MNKKVGIILLVACLVVVGGFAVVVFDIGKDGMPDNRPADNPIIKGDGVDNTMKEIIFEQLSEPNEALGKYVSLDESGIKTYHWQSIEELLYKAPSDMSTEDYVVLMQVLQGMTEINPDILPESGKDDYVSFTDYKVLEQFVQRGCDENGLTLTMANICTLYKEWVEDILVEPRSKYLFNRTRDKERELMALYLEEEMLKAGMLNGFLLGDSKMTRQKKQVPETKVNYVEDQKYGVHTIKIANQEVKIHYFFMSMSSRVLSQKASIIRMENETPPKTVGEGKKEELDELYNFTVAFEVGGVLITTEDYTVQMIKCFNDTELEIRACAFALKKYNTNEAVERDGRYIDVSGALLKAQLEADEPTELIKDYLEWSEKYSATGYLTNYKNNLNKVFFNYIKTHDEFGGNRIEDLTPAKIIELDKKLRDKNYRLDLGDPP